MFQSSEKPYIEELTSIEKLCCSSWEKWLLGTDLSDWITWSKGEIVGKDYV